MKLSYIISTKDRALQLDFSLFTLVEQTLKDFEVILVDDNSTEDIYSVFKKYRKRLNISYIRLEHKAGWRDCGIGLNHGIRQAKGDVIAVSMPEVALSPRGIELLYQPHFTLYDYPHHFTYDAGTNRLAVLMSPLWLPEDVQLKKKEYLACDYKDFLLKYANEWDIDNAIHMGSGWGNFVCISMLREVWYEIGGMYEFESWGSTDPNIQHRRRHVGCSDTLIDLPEALILHQWHASSAKRDAGMDQLESRPPEEVYLSFLTPGHRLYEIVRQELHA